MLQILFAPCLPFMTKAGIVCPEDVKTRNPTNNDNKESLTPKMTTNAINTR